MDKEKANSFVEGFPCSSRLNYNGFLSIPLSAILTGLLAFYYCIIHQVQCTHTQQIGQSRRLSGNFSLLEHPFAAQSSIQ
eukprot:scaffold10266_cov294-Chaetoceros_neogracile.AAC.12